MNAESPPSHRDHVFKLLNENLRGDCKAGYVLHKTGEIVSCFHEPLAPEVTEVASTQFRVEVNRGRSLHEEFEVATNNPQGCPVKPVLCAMQGIAESIDWRGGKASSSNLLRGPPESIQHNTQGQVVEYPPQSPGPDRAYSASWCKFYTNIVRLEFRSGRNSPGSLTTPWE